MTERERLLKVLKGETPDRVPWFADLGHWYKSEAGTPWNLYDNKNVSAEIARLHREVRAGFYIDTALHEEYYDEGISRAREIRGDYAVETFQTPVGQLRMERKWSPISFSWDITKRLVTDTQDLKVLLYAVRGKHFRPRYENWDIVERLTGDVGLAFPNVAYTGLGSLISYYMGVAKTLYGIYDEPDIFREYVAAFNAKHLELVDIYCHSPAPHIIFGDNLSGDIQSPPLFREFSFQHYKNIADRLHQAGKTVSAHLDGTLNKIITVVAEAGIDVADACTPKPTGDLTPAEIRQQAGNRMIVMGGISPTMWLPETGEKTFIAHVKEWLDLRHVSNRLVLSAGDQVPPGTKLQRIKLVHDLVEEYGRY